MSTTGDLPESVGDFGQEFNYSQWPPGTIAEFCNVPWGNDYRDLYRPENRNELNQYIDNKVGSSGAHIFKEMMYLRPHQPLRVPVGYNFMSQFNYVRVRNPHVVNDFVRDYYYFVTDLEQLAPNTTGVSLQLDVWATYFDVVVPGRGYLERGHYGVAAEDGFQNFGRDYLSVPEGLDVGSDHVSVYQAHEQIASTRNAWGLENVNYGVMVWSTTALQAGNYGTVDNPVLTTASGSSMSQLPNGASAFYFDNPGEFQSYLNKNSDKPWMLQGIISVMAVPKISRYATDSANFRISTADNVRTVGQFVMKPLEKRKMVNWRDRQEISAYLGRYKHLKKFLTYPYTAVELTAYNGAPLLLKPELWDRDATVVEVPHFALPGPRLVIYPKRYATTSGATEVKDNWGYMINDGGEFLDVATGIYDFPTFSVVNNSYMNYLASNRNAIQYQHQTADWSQQKALSGNQLSFDQSTMGMATSAQLNQIGINAANAQTNLSNTTTGYRALAGAGNSIVGGLRGGAAGAALGVANAGLDAAISMNQNTQSNAINTSAMAQSNRAQLNQMGYNRDTNKAYADFAARGDYANTIAGINAKIQDARMIQPTTSGQIGGDAFNLSAWQWGYTLKVKSLPPNALASIGEFWLRFGYAIQRFITPPSNFHCMSRFTYWKFQEFYIHSSTVPETIKQTIRGIFEKGVTVWRYADDMATLDPANNNPLSGIRFSKD